MEASVENTEVGNIVRYHLTPPAYYAQLFLSGLALEHVALCPDCNSLFQAPLPGIRDDAPLWRVDDATPGDYVHTGFDCDLLCTRFADSVPETGQSGWTSRTAEVWTALG